jgi:hypothetical protein
VAPNLRVPNVTYGGLTTAGGGGAGNAGGGGGGINGGGIGSRVARALQYSIGGGAAAARRVRDAIPGLSDFWQWRVLRSATSNGGVPDAATLVAAGLPFTFYELGPAAATATTVSVTLETLQLAARLINRDANPSGETYACAPLAGAHCLVTVLSAAGLNLRTLVGMGVSWTELVDSFGLRAAYLSHPACMWLDPVSLPRMRLSTQPTSGSGVSLDRLIMDVPAYAVI